MTEVVLGDRNGDHVLIHAGPVPDSYYDVPTEVTVRVRGFAGFSAHTAEPTDFVQLRDALRALSRTLAGTAVFEPGQGWVRIELIGDARGGLAVRGQLREEEVEGLTQVSFAFAIDQSYLPPVIAALDQLLGKA